MYPLIQDTLQVICRDVWALNLCLLPNPIHGDVDGIYTLDEGKDSDKDIHGTSDRDPVTADADSSDPLDQDEEIDQLLRENSDSSDSSSDEESSNIPGNVSVERKRKGMSPEEGAASTIAVLAVTCWLLRIPVMYQDFARYVCTCRKAIYTSNNDLAGS